jgi:N4-gp56 family major capsid protein
MADAMTLSSDLSSQYREHFESQLLTYAVQATRKAEFGQKAPLPKGIGSKQISFFKYGAPSDTQIADLTDASADETLASTVYAPIDVFGTSGDSADSGVRQLSLAKVTATLQQIGQVVVISDVLNNTEFLNSLAQATKTNGEDAALKCDNIVKAELCNSTVPTGSSDTEGGSTMFAGANISLTNNASGANALPVTGASDVLDVVTQLRINRAPEINGGYVSIAAPQVLRDLMRDSDWLAAASRSNVSAFYNGEVGSLYGVRFVEDTNPFRCGSGSAGAIGNVNDIDTEDSEGVAFCTFFLGGEAFGVPALSGDSPMSPSIQIVDTPDKKDPLNQVVTVGFKTMYTAKVLTAGYYIRYFSRTGYAGV